MKNKEPKARVFCDGEGYNTSNKLKNLVYLYLSHLKKNEETAMKAVWETIQEMKEEYWDPDEKLTEEEKGILTKAANGDLKSIQFLIRTEPDVIHFPFIREKLIEILQRFKWDRPKESKYKLRDIKSEIWPGFLADRTGGKQHFNKDYLVSLMKHHMNWGMKKSEAADSIGRVHGLNCERLRRLGRLGKKGRPKKRGK